VSARSDRLTAVVLLVFAGYTMVSAWQLGYWQGRIPGPGFAPLWIGAGLALCALFLLLRRRAPATAPPTAPTGALSLEAPPVRTRRELVLTVEIAAMTIAATWVMPRLGMIVGVAVLLVALIKLLGGTWRSAVAAAVVLPLAFYAIFVRWLQVPVPKGPWGF
jgi:hypothetical protein